MISNGKCLVFSIWFFSNSETMLHLLKGSLGTGILAMPKAFYNAGYIVGVIATIIIGLLCIYCMRILVRSEYELCKRKRVPSMTYPATAESALLEGPKSLRRFSKISMWVRFVSSRNKMYEKLYLPLVFCVLSLKYKLPSIIDCDKKNFC